MTFNIHDFKANGLQFGGARPSLFHVQLTIPPTLGGAAGGTTNDMRAMSFVIKAANIPHAPMESIDVHYFGRPVKFNGDRVFPDWEITVLNDEDFGVRRQLESWSNRINTHITNWQTPFAFGTGQLSPTNIGYKSTATVTQFSKSGVGIAAYQFEGLWPKEIEQMQLDWGSVNQIQEYRVKFAYDLWTPVAPQTDGMAGPGPGALTPPFTGLE